MNTPKRTNVVSLVLGAVICCGALMSTGCQVSIGGQTVPSAFYMKDDIQYFPKGPEFKLSKEAAALKAASGNRPAGR